MALEQSIYIPSLVWYQNKNNIVIDIEISDYKNQSLNLKENIFDFKCQKDIKQYEMNFELCNNIKQHYVKYNESNINIISRSAYNGSFVQCFRTTNHIRTTTNNI